MGKRVDKLKDKDNWKYWVGNEIVKHSGKPFKSGLKIGIPNGMGINPNSGKQAFIMDDCYVDCYQCKFHRDTNFKISRQNKYIQVDYIGYKAPYAKIDFHTHSHMWFLNSKDARKFMKLVID